jgi:hypothetical protein
MAMKLKLDENGNVVVKDDKPVYVYDDGKEIAADVEGMFGKIADLNKENQKHRLSAKELSEKLERFGNADPDDIEALLDTFDELGGPEGIEKLRKGKDVDIDAIKKQIADVYESKLADKDKLIQTKDGDIRKLLVSNGFSSSKFINEQLTIPADIVEATFGKHFKVEDGQVVAYLGENKILSREKPGEVATIDEALQTIVDHYPMKDRIMKAAGGGSGAKGGGGGGGNGKAENALSRSQYNALDASSQAKHVLSGGTVTD